MTRLKIRLTSLAAILAISGASSSGQILLSTSITTGNLTTPPTTISTISESLMFSEFEAHATLFTPSQSANLVRVDLGLFTPGSTGDIQVGIFNNDTSGAPGTPNAVGTELEIVTIDSTSVPTDPNTLTSVTFSGAASLSFGNSYWLAVGAPTAGTAFVSWGTDPNSPDSNPFASTFPGDLDAISFGSPFDRKPTAYSVYAVPEPSTYALLIGSACLGLVIWQRKRRLMTD